jgi:hypothetical protein
MQTRVGMAPTQAGASGAELRDQEKRIKMVAVK